MRVSAVYALVLVLRTRRCLTQMLCSNRITHISLIRPFLERDRVLCEAIMKRGLKKRRKRYSCKVCNEKTHSILLGCPEFQRFIPGQPGGSDSPPKEVCLMCLGTVYSNCLHKSLTDYKKYICKIGRRPFIIYRCSKHKNAQD